MTVYYLANKIIIARKPDVFGEFETRKYKSQGDLVGQTKETISIPRPISSRLRDQKASWCYLGQCISNNPTAVCVPRNLIATKQPIECSFRNNRRQHAVILTIVAVTVFVPSSYAGSSGVNPVTGLRLNSLSLEYVFFSRPGEPCAAPERNSVASFAKTFVLRPVRKLPVLFNFGVSDQEFLRRLIPLEEFSDEPLECFGELKRR
ncbi:hypothetical protein P5673_024719 [Acropora cervicornis]|uniref:Uncharacterized protein n=1 Tax=Acropora cervicornis TaxID=6130 RepID=A0AAD9Q443_ACRCE|nr:hypothetical protein P5673_024719 [Acropora cervicornis]